MSAPLRLCGYCQTWHIRPCGEGCYLQPNDPVWINVSSEDAKRSEAIKAIVEALERFLAPWADFNQEELSDAYTGIDGQRIIAGRAALNLARAVRLTEEK